MRSGTSMLNPYADSYVPLSRRGVAEENKDFKLTAKDFKNGNENICLISDTKENHLNREDLVDSDGIGTLPTTEDSTWKAQSVHGSCGSSSNNPSKITEKRSQDDDFDMDMAFLQMTFPDVADDSISYLYLACGGDLDATIDLLGQLGLNTVDSPVNLPDTLDSSDVSESGSSSEAAFLKLKNVAGEDGSSSAGSSGSSHLMDVKK